MPRVPTYAGDRVATRPVARMPRTAPTADVYGAQLGATIAQTGAVAATEIGRIVEEQKKRADELALVTGKRQFNDLYRQQALSTDRGQTLDGRPGAKGLLTMQGAEPHEKLDANVEQWDEQAEMIIGGAKNVRQRQLLEAMRDDERARYLDQAQRHAFNEYAKYETGEIQATTKSTLDTASAAAASGHEGWQDTVTQKLKELDQLIEAKGDKLGFEGPEAKARGKAELRSQLHLGVVNALLDKGDDIAATEYWDAAHVPSAAYPQGEILESQSAQTKSKLEINSTDGRADRNAELLMDRMGPKHPGDPSNLTAMSKEARLLATEGGHFNLKVFNQTMAYLKVRTAEWQADQKGVEDGNTARLAEAVARNVPLAQVQAMPEWANVDGGTHARILNDYETRARQKLADQRSAVSEARQAHNWQRSLLGEDLEDAEREDRRRTHEGWLTYGDLALHPGRLAAMDDTQLTARIKDMGRDQQISLRRQWQDSQGQIAGSGFATVDPSAFRAALIARGFPAAPQSDEQKRVENALHLRIEQAIVREQIALAKGSGVKVILTAPQQEDVMNRVFNQKVLVGGSIWGEQEAVAATLTTDAIGKARVRFATLKQYVPKYVENMRRFIKEVNQPSGTSRTSELSDPDIDDRYSEAMEYAYAAELIEPGLDHWKTVLLDRMGKYRPPPGVPTPRPGNRPSGTPPPSFAPARGSGK